MPPGSFTGSVAELFAALGLDTSSFDRGLRESKVKLQVTADEMKRPIEGMRVLLSQLSTQAGPSAAIAAFDQLKLKVDSTRESITRLQRELWTALANGREALKNAESTVARQALGTVGGGAGGGGTIGGLGDDSSGGGRGSQMLVTRLTERFLIYHALRAAVRGVAEVFKEAEDITRRMDQTGWGSRGVQELATAARNVHTPIESVTTAIGHLQTKVEAPDVGLLKVFDRLGIKYTEFRRLMETNPQGGFEQMATALSHVKDHGQLAIDMMTVFGDHSGKLIEFITHWNDLKKEAAKNPVLTETDLANMHQVTVWYDKMLALGAQGIVGAVGIARTFPPRSSGPRRNPDGRFVTGGIESQPTMGITSSTLGQGLAIPPAPLPTDAKSLDAARRILDEYRSAHQLALGKMAKDYDDMLLLERQGLATNAQVVEFRSHAEAKARDEQLKAFEAGYREQTRILEEFGAGGKRHTQEMIHDWNKLNEAFRQGRISIGELTVATAHFRQVLQDQRAGPDMQTAFLMFEQGLIGTEELMRAKERYRARQGLSQAQEDYLNDKGEDNWGFYLGDRQTGIYSGAVGRYQQQINRNRTNLDFTVPNPMQFNPRPLFPESAPRPQIIENPAYRRPEGSGASINLVPLDQFSESMVRHWMRQGMTTS